MITIEQLLESVDLDFEPKWVAKDKDGGITVFVHKPTIDHDEDYWSPNVYKHKLFGPIKLAEFDGLDWTECIYEVPRKTTGKIERFTLEDFVCITDIEDSIRNVLDGRAFDKLNALVDAVNKHADIIQQIGEWGARKGECLWCETLTKFEPSELKGANNE